MRTFQDLILALQNVRTPRQYSGEGIASFRKRRGDRSGGSNRP
jgi:hypothetical protein